ncbi:MAG: hypothetical protein ACLRQY_08780 [[Clostridium] leptum]
MEITMVCPCLLGLEGLVKDELLYLEAQNIRPQNGRVVFQGGPEILARANINCRYGERILIQMGAFEAKTFEAVSASKICPGSCGLADRTAFRSREEAWIPS